MIFLTKSGPYGPIRAYLLKFFFKGVVELKIDGPVWVYINAYGSTWALMGPYWPKKSQKIHKQIALIGAFKEPCTLP